MKSIVRFVQGRVTRDVPEMLPEIQQLVSMVDSEASLPVYKFLNDYPEKVDSGLYAALSRCKEEGRTGVPTRM